MKWWCRHWYEIGIISGILAFVVLVIKWNDFSVLSRVSLINFIGLMIHQFEEYCLPGGTPVFMNKYMRGGDERYPLNQFSAMIVNVLIAYICYLLPVIFPKVIWLGMAPILFGCVFQVIMHLAVFGIKFHRIYNPGLGAVILIHVPCGIYYIRYAVRNNLMQGSSWLFTIVYLFGMVAITALFGQILFSSRESKYPFDEREIAAGERFAKMMGL